GVQTCALPILLYILGSQTGVRVPPGVREVVQGVRGENHSAITENGRNSRNVYPLKQNCNVYTETSFCASKSPKFCILPCKAAFLSNKHNNDRNDEQTLIQEQITEKMYSLCWTTLRPRPICIPHLLTSCRVWLPDRK